MVIKPGIKDTSGYHLAFMDERDLCVGITEVVALHECSKYVQDWIHHDKLMARMLVVGPGTTMPKVR